MAIVYIFERETETKGEGHGSRGKYSYASKGYFLGLFVS